MRTLILSLISSVVLLSGCSTTMLNPWDGLTTEISPAATPLDCGSFPMPTESHVEGESVLDADLSKVMAFGLQLLEAQGQSTRHMDMTQLSYDGDEVVYDKASLNDLNAYRVCSEANEAIAGEHALQIGQLKLARKGLTEAGRAQRNIADMREEMLRDERRHNFFQSIGLYAVIVGMGFAL